VVDVVSAALIKTVVDAVVIVPEVEVKVAFTV
jgi:hypothetical protein